jgi:hypothetical protein
MVTAGELLERQITLIRDPVEIKLLVQGQEVAGGTDVDTLITNCRALGDSDPLVLPLRASIDLGNLSRSERRTLILSLSPSLDVWEVIDDSEAGQGNWDCTQYEVPVIETGVLIDHQPWGWMPFGKVYGHIFPAGREDVFSLYLGFVGAGMGSGERIVGISAVGDLAALEYDYCMEDSSYKITYEVEDWLPLVRQVFVCNFVGQKLCPACEESSDWRIGYGTSLPLSNEFIGELMKDIWLPCTQHKNLGAQLTVAGFDAHEWHWTGETWSI